MFGFVRQIFVSAMIFFGCNILGVNTLKCVLVNNQECKIISEIININSDETLFYLYSITISKWSGSFNNMYDPYSKMCVPDVIENVKVKCQSIQPNVKY